MSQAIDGFIQKRSVIPTVTIFLQYQSRYLFLHRSAKKSVDPDVLNGVGGKIEAGESAIEASVREIYEETGYRVSAESLSYAGTLHLYGGYVCDWVTAFFIAQVSTPDVPIGMSTPDGELAWMTYEDFIASPIRKCDDLNYIFADIHQHKVFHGAATYNENFLITDFTKHYLSISL